MKSVGDELQAQSLMQVKDPLGLGAADITGPLEKLQRAPGPVRLHSAGARGCRVGLAALRQGLGALGDSTGGDHDHDVALVGMIYPCFNPGHPEVV